MQYIQSSQDFKRSRIPNLKIPATREEFSKMTYAERAQLWEEHRAVYDRFAKPKPTKPWEQD